MPYVITSTDMKARRAVVPLDDQVDPKTDEVTDMGVRGVVRDIMLEHAMAASPSWGEGSNAANWAAVDQLSAEGGTVGPLPDGTTIKVEPVTGHYLREWLWELRGRRVCWGPSVDTEDPAVVAELVDAYRQAQQVASLESSLDPFSDRTEAEPT